MTAVKTTEVQPKGKKEISKKNRPFSLKSAPFKTAMPYGFSFEHNKPIKRSNFDHDRWYFEHRAAYFEHRAAQMQAEADDAAKYGTRTERHKVQRVAKLQSQIAELRKQLEADGVDVDALIANVKAT